MIYDNKHSQSLKEDRKSNIINITFNSNNGINLVKQYNGNITSRFFQKLRSLNLKNVYNFFFYLLCYFLIIIVNNFLSKKIDQRLINKD